MDQNKLNVRIIEHGYNKDSDWTCNRNDKVEAVVTAEADDKIKFTVPDKNGRYELLVNKFDLLKEICNTINPYCFQDLMSRRRLL